jgi:hypothetical protein
LVAAAVVDGGRLELVDKVEEVVRGRGHGGRVGRRFDEVVGLRSRFNESVLDVIYGPNLTGSNTYLYK